MIEIYSSPIQAINWSFAEHLQVSIDIKRDDLLHPVISGNKWRKLKYLLEDAKHKQCEPIITMGGNWSNHLHALAFAGQSLGVKTQAFVRAHPDQALTPTLIDCQNWGMALNYVSRKEYAQLRQHKAWDSLQQDYPKMVKRCLEHPLNTF